MEFSSSHRDAGKPLQAWRHIMEAQDFKSFAQLKLVMNATDKVGDFYVFDIGGNKYRIVAAIHFNRQMVFVRHVFTHAEYDKWSPGK